MSKKISVADLISPAHYATLNDMLQGKHSHYWLYGGRGSFKSSLVGIAIPLIMMSDPEANAICLRNVGHTCRTSVYNQIVWGINQLGVSHLWKISRGDKGCPPMTYLPFGTKIYFSGLDDPEKVKSIKPQKGYLRISWFEEFPQFTSMEVIRNARQSIRRGNASGFITIYSGNPVRFKNHWSNEEFYNADFDPKAYTSLTTYLDTPKHLCAKWLGEDFLHDAEMLKNTNPDAYTHEYLGIPTGYGTGVFDNIRDVTITEEEIARFDNVGAGIDWGFAEDPCTFTLSHYDPKRRELYIYDEIFQNGLLNIGLAERIRNNTHYNNELIIADSAEPKSIEEFKQMGFRINGAIKGSGSIEYGIKQLQELNAIYIDKKRCPNTYREFMNAEYDVDKFNNVLPHLIKDKNNHVIDNIRYRMENEWVGTRWGWS